MVALSEIVQLGFPIQNYNGEGSTSRDNVLSSVIWLEELREFGGGREDRRCERKKSQEQEIMKLSSKSRAQQRCRINARYLE